MTKEMFLKGFAGVIGMALIATLATAQRPDAPPGGAPGGLPGGFRPFEFPQPGQLLTGFVQDQLKLTAEQKKQLAEFQKEVDAKLASILNTDQNKSLQKMRTGKGFGPPAFGPPGKGGAKQPGGFGPPGGFPGFGANSLDAVKKQIDARDEEWKVIGPKLQKVVAARRVLSADGKQTGFGFGGFGAGNVVTQAQAELKTMLDDPKQTKAEVEEKIAGVRKARQKAQADLDAVQRDLRLLLTPSQDAILVSAGYLD